MVKRDVEPFINLGVQCVVLITELLGCYLLFYSLSLCRGSVLVSSADVEGVIPTGTRVPGEDIGGENAYMRVRKLAL